ncbi:lipase [Kitasatospora sp. MAA19]|uniref:esterase/lipase family protein n=1 Tax=Kitasatospora sp. MAA19 TaxID=3035090 RepID=UPI002474DDD4|nr:lipase [Kitasatospora sp. MAA19]
MRRTPTRPGAPRPRTPRPGTPRRTPTALSAVLLTLAALLLGTPTTAQAAATAQAATAQAVTAQTSAAQAAAAPLALEATFPAPGNGWAKVERYLDTTPGFRAEQYPADGRGDQDGARRTYFGGTGEPYSGRFLLYSATGWDTGGRQTPVLLVHGANDNVDRAWANPAESGTCGASACPSTGLAQYLAGTGHRVFAIGFAHKQGDNLLQAQTVGDAVALIRTRLGVSQVDVVAWSKGEVAARAYVSSVRPSWGRAYAGDVRRLITLGGPNGGLDYVYAHGWSFDLAAWPACGGTANAPSPHLYMTCYGTYTAQPCLGVLPTGGHDCYPGQRQLLARWDGRYGVDGTSQDWWTTYYGGQGFYTSGQGIQAAIDAGSLIAPLQQAGVPASVRTYLLAGGSADIPGVLNENRGPSDGIVFTASALDTTGVATIGGTRLLAGLNHLELAWAPEAESQVDGWLD